jgi:carboxylesterase type B
VTNADEGFMFTDPQTNQTGAEYAKMLFPRLTPAQAQLVEEAYEGFGSRFNQSSQIQAEAIFLCPTLSLQDSFSKSDKPAWKGQFAIPPAIHIQDVFYYFNSLGSINVPGYPTLPPLFETDRFAEKFGKSFFDFIISLDPNVKRDSTAQLPSWPEYNDTGRPEEMYFGQTSDGKNADIHARDVDRGLLERCKMWASLASSTYQ